VPKVVGAYNRMVRGLAQDGKIDEWGANTSVCKFGEFGNFGCKEGFALVLESASEGQQV